MGNKNALLASREARERAALALLSSLMGSRSQVLCKRRGKKETASLERLSEERRKKCFQQCRRRSFRRFGTFDRPSENDSTSFFLFSLHLRRDRFAFHLQVSVSLARSLRLSYPKAKTGSSQTGGGNQTSISFSQCLPVKLRPRPPLLPLLLPLFWPRASQPSSPSPPRRWSCSRPWPGLPLAQGSSTVREGGFRKL